MKSANLINSLMMLVLLMEMVCTAGANEFWDTTVVDSKGDVGQYTSLTILPSDYPAISYYDGTNDDLKYAWYDGNDWRTTTVDSAEDVGRYTSLVILPSGYPAISYYGYTNRDLRYAELVDSDPCNPSHWQRVTVDSNGSVGAYSSLAVLPSGQPAISYYNATSDDLKYAWRDPNGWHTVTVDKDSDVGAYSSLTILPSGHPAISYYKYVWRTSDHLEHLKYAELVGPNPNDPNHWEVTTAIGYPQGGLHTSVAVLPSGQPAISFQAWAGYCCEWWWEFAWCDWGLLKYAWRTGTSWSSITVDDLGTTGSWTSLVVLPSGQPAISYHEESSRILKYSWYDGNDWHTTIVDSEGAVGQYTSLTILPSGEPAISYYDFSQGNLKFATPSDVPIAPVSMSTSYTSIAQTDLCGTTVVNDGPAECSGSIGEYPNETRSSSSVRLETMDGGHLRAQFLIKGRDGSYSECIFWDPIFGDCLEWETYSVSCKNAKGTLSGTLEVGSSIDWPPSSKLELYTSVIKAGSEGDREDYYLMLWRGHTEITRLDPWTAKENTATVFAGETLTYELFAIEEDHWDDGEEYERLFEFRFILRESEASTNEMYSSESKTVETITIDTAVAENIQVTGDLSGTLDFNSFKIVNVDSGPFANQGYFKGEWEATLESNTLHGSCCGVSLFRPKDRKIYLKGAMSGDMAGTVEGELVESIKDSNVYDQYITKWDIGRVNNSTSSATLGLTGQLSSLGHFDYPSTELYILQTNIEGNVSGHYGEALNTVVTNVSVSDTNNPCYGEGFSILSFVADGVSGKGWTYSVLTPTGIIELKGLISSPLFGFANGGIYETELGRNLSLQIYRVDLGRPPAPNLKVDIWGPERVGSIQTVDYIIGYRNDGLLAGDDVIVFYALDHTGEFISASAGANYNEFNHEIAWFLGKVPANSGGLLSATVKHQWSLQSKGMINNSALIIDPSMSQLAIENKIQPLSDLESSPPVSLCGNGINHNLEKNPESVAKWNRFAYDVSAAQVPDLFASGNFWQDVVDVQKATPQAIIGYDDGKPIISYDPHSGEPIYAQPGYRIIENMLNSGYDYLVYPNQNNGLKYFEEMVHISVDDVIAYSGFTRTALTAILSGNLECGRLILISPMSGVGEWGHWKSEIEHIRRIYPNMEIVIYQSQKDRAADSIAGKLYSWLYQVKFSEAEIPWLKNINIKVNPGTDEFTWDRDGDGNADPFPALEIHGKIIAIDENVINTKNHGALLNYIIEVLEGKGEIAASLQIFILVEHDPNRKLGPKRRILAGQRLKYKVEYENEGEGIAFGVYFTDTLDEDLNDCTLEIGPVIDSNTGEKIADPGIGLTPKNCTIAD